MAMCRLGLAVLLVSGVASADTFGGFSGVDRPYLVNQDRVCQPLAVDKGTAKGTTWTVLNAAPISASVKSCLDKVTATVHLPVGAHSNIEVAK